jgi:predicted TIM-barrel fold metal-dependent hydrolase
VSALDLDALEAIDVHVHVEQDQYGHLSLDDELLAAASKYFKGEPYHPTVPQIADDYRALTMAAVVFTADSELSIGHPTLSNEEIAEAAAQHPDVLIPFGSIDPARGASGVRAARRLVTEHGVRGFKFHPSLQGFEPNDRRHYRLYEELQSLGVPALFRTGQTGIGSGLPGGRGIKLRYSDPMPVGSKVRLTATLTGVEEIKGGYQLTVSAVIERAGADKPVCIAEPVFRFLS